MNTQQALTETPAIETPIDLTASQREAATGTPTTDTAAQEAARRGLTAEQFRKGYDFKTMG
ncbi:MAG: hypothetical protein WC043_02545 [Pseudobdellovibrionaceae bacterium]